MKRYHLIKFLFIKYVVRYIHWRMRRQYAIRKDYWREHIGI